MLKRYSPPTPSHYSPDWSMQEDPTGNYLRRTDVEAQMVPRPDPEKVRTLKEMVEYFDGLIKGEEYHQSICDECHTSVQRSRDRVYKYTEWKAALMRLMGVEVE